MNTVTNNTQVSVYIMFSWYQGSGNVCQENIPHTIAPSTSASIHAFMSFMPHSDPTIQMLHHQRFSYFLLSNFGEHVQIVASVSYSQRRSSAYPGCYDWLFELLLPSFQLEAAHPFSSDLWHQQAIFKPITAAHSFSHHFL